MLCSDVLDALFWLFAVPACVGALLSAKSGRDFLDYVEDRLRDPPRVPDRELPAVALVVPVKGAEHGLAANLASLALQDYPRYQVVVCCADASDPALGAARLALGPGCRVAVAGEPPPGTGEKVHNLLAGVDAAGDGAEVLVFADSDGEVTPGWLRKLVAPLADPALGAVTAYRWHFPEEGGFWPLLRSVWDSAVTTIMDRNGRSFAWGGGTALRRSVFDSARVRDFWRGAVSDDLRLSDALSAAGLGIRFAPEAMVASTGQCGRSEFLSWTVRQLTIMRVYRFRTWLAGCVSHVAYCGAQALCLLQALQGNPVGLAALLLILLPGMAKGGMRAYVCALVFPEREGWLERYGWVYFWMTPLATWVWLHAFLRSALTRRIAWRGRIYDLASPTEARAVRRPRATPAPPSE